MRARNLKPGLFKNELLGSADPLITILFEGLWCSADREGRLEDRPLRLCAEVFPYRRKITERKVSAWLDWLQEHKFIVRYSVLEKRFIQITEFLTHQNPHRDERPSEIPALTSVEHSASTVQAPCDRDKSTDVVRLNPDSGLLNPESSLREKRARERSRINGHGPDPYATTEAIKTAYPPGTYRQSNWILAERAISKLLADGESPEDLVRLTAEFRAQQDAKGSTGTQFVLSPEKFFGPDGHWRGPFPLPTASQSTPARRMRTAQEIAAAYPEDAA